jgi:curved DNA-binding protein CbpA
MSTPAPPFDLYAILGVPRDATQALIDQAYRALVRRYHPDSRTTGDAALAVADDTRLRDVMAAYLVLGNPDRRADFDRGNRTITAPAVDIRVHRHTRHRADAPSVSAGPVYWYRPAPTVPDSHTRTPAADGAQRNGRDGRDGHAGAAGGRAMPAPPHGPEPDVEPDLEPDLSQQVRALTAQVSQLTFARDSNRRIGMAAGIVMNQRQVDEAHAFDLLRRISQNTNHKLRDIAEDVIRDRRV